MFGIGGMELFFIFVIVLLLFGAKRVPEIARSFGKASREFKKAKDEILDYSEKVINAAEKDAEADDEKTARKGSDKADQSDDNKTV